MSPPDPTGEMSGASADLDRQDRWAAHRDRLLGLRYAIGGALEVTSHERRGLLQLVEDALLALENELDPSQRSIKARPPP
jgi:hypothetical protein